MTNNPVEIGDKIKIIVVENELIVAKNIENQLRKLCYDVIAVSDNGAEAVAKTAELTPDLVLMDINLAGEMDGVDAARIIGETYQVPVVYLTAFADNETLQRAKITGPFGYVIKPFEPKKLHTTIEIALYKHGMEKKLKESELRFRTLAAASPVGVFQTDIDGQCIYVNERWCEIAGQTPQQALGTGWLNSLHPEDRDNVLDNWNRMVQSGEKFTREYRFQTLAGITTWVYGHAAPITNEAGEKTGYIGTITDITLRKKLEDELLTAKKIESIGILAGGIAHDFNNLLSIILGNISMLLGETNITADQINMLKNAENASIQAAQLAQKLITFSRGGWLDRKPINFLQLLQDIVKQKFHAWEDFFEVSVPDRLQPIDGDPNQLKQVFTNIIANAVEAGKINMKGDIAVTAENVETCGTDPSLKKKPCVKITISDKGAGIPKEILEKIFDPYFTTKFRGTDRGLGLGLTICYSIIRKHDGHIQVASEPGQGTTVTVYLPSAPVSQQTPAVPKEPAEPQPAGKALIMDDEEIIQDVTKQMLERLDFEVHTFNEGRQTLAAIESAKKAGKPFNVAFLDLLNKKGLGGKETLKQLGTSAPSLVVIAISGFSDGSERDTLKKIGFNEVLFKPFKLDDLKTILEKTGIL